MAGQSLAMAVKPCIAWQNQFKIIKLKLSIQLWGHQTVLCPLDDFDGITIGVPTKKRSSPG